MGQANLVVPNGMIRMHFYGCVENVAGALIPHYDAQKKAEGTSIMAPQAF